MTERRIECEVGILPGDPRPTNKTEAKKALVAAAFTETHKHCETCSCDVPPDRQLIHCRLGGMGADHDLESALAHVEESDEIVWITSPFCHDLAVVVGERVYCYAVRNPELSS